MTKYLHCLACLFKSNFPYFPNTPDSQRTAFMIQFIQNVQKEQICGDRKQIGKCQKLGEEDKLK